MRGLAVQYMHMKCRQTKFQVNRISFSLKQPEISPNERKCYKNLHTQQLLHQFKIPKHIQLSREQKESVKYQPVSTAKQGNKRHIKHLNVFLPVQIMKCKVETNKISEKRNITKYLTTRQSIGEKVQITKDTRFFFFFPSLYMNVKAVMFECNKQQNMQHMKPSHFQTKLTVLTRRIIEAEPNPL